MKTGDRVSLKKPFWYKNEDLGGRTGRVISTYSYVLVELYEYHSNPIKCFKNEVHVDSYVYTKKKGK